MFCPSCGAQLEVETSHAHLVVCEFCDSTLILDGAAARVSGKMATLRPPAGVLYRGAEGSLMGRRFRVLGRVRYGYRAGFWDEWFLVFEDGSEAWISESEEDLTLESCSRADGLGLTYEGTAPGSRIQLGKLGFHVDERDVATCEGGEGQLPFAIQQGEEVPFLDCSEGSRFATIEFDEDGTRVFLGRRLGAAELELDVSREEAGIGTGLAAAQAAGTRERVVRGEGGALTVRCEKCGSPMEVDAAAASEVECDSCGNLLDLTRRRVDCPGCEAVLVLRGGEDTRSVVCKGCQTQVDVGSDVPAILANLKDVRRVRPPLPLGARGQLRGTAYTVVGFLRWVEKDMWGTYISDELLLRPAEGPSRWLILENGHFSLSEELEERPKHIPSLRRAPFMFMDRKWLVFEHQPPSSGPKVTFVDGEFPWVATLGDQAGYTDCISPPFLLTEERTANEVEYYRAEYIPRAEIEAAFGPQLADLPPPVGVAPHQPYPGWSWRKQCLGVMAVFSCIFFVMLCMAANSGRKIGERSLQFSQAKTPDSYLTESFFVAAEDTVAQAVFKAPSLTNSWLYFEGALIDAEDKALLDFSTEISYYEGRDYEGYWSEGSRDDSVVFKISKPGEYRILLSGNGGSGNYANGPLQGDPGIVVELYEKVELARYYVLGLLLCLAWVVVEGILWGLWEAQRWGDEDDD